MVKTDFKKLSDVLNEEREITILYGGVLLDVTRFRNANYDPWAKHVNDPMTKLKEWLDQAGYRLVDLLLTFDKDKSLTLDLRELKEGIHVSHISLQSKPMLRTCSYVILRKVCLAFSIWIIVKGGPSDLGTKKLQKY